MTSLLAWYRYNRRQTQLVHGMGRWESFWRAVERVMGEKR